MDVAYVGRVGDFYQSFPEHSHGYWEIILNKKGCGTMYVNDTPYPFEPGDVAVIPPGMVHRKESIDGFSDVCLFIKNFRPIGTSPFKILHDDENQTIGCLMDMASRFSNIDNVYEHAVLNVIGDLLYQVLVFIYVNHQNNDSRFDAVLEAMQNNIGNPDFDLSAAIEKTGYCKGYFRKIFKEFSGVSPVNYMQMLRINYAKSLLNQFGTSRSMKDIAYASGFTDPLYFSRVFKKMTGICPKTYAHQQNLFDQSMIVMDN